MPKNGQKHYDYQGSTLTVVHLPQASMKSQTQASKKWPQLALLGK